MYNIVLVREMVGRIIILLAVIFGASMPSPARSDDGKAIMKGLFGIMMQKAQEEIEKDQSTPEPVTDPSIRNSEYTEYSDNCNGPFGNITDAPELPVCVKRCCGGLTIAKNIQISLQKLGYYNGAVDGDIGTGTRKGITTWESENESVQDGVISAQEYAAMMKQAADAHYKPASTETASVPSPTNIPEELYGIPWKEWPSGNQCDWAPCRHPCGAAVRLKWAEHSSYHRTQFSDKTNIERHYYNTWEACKEEVRLYAEEKTGIQEAINKKESEEKKGISIIKAYPFASGAINIS